MQLRFTVAGKALFDINPSAFTCTRLVLTDAFGYVLPDPPAVLVGTPVYDVTAPLPKEVVNTNTLRFIKLLDNSVGSFSFGEAALYSGATMVAIGVNPTPIPKVAASGAENGNYLTLNFFLSYSNTNSYGFVKLGNSDSRLQLGQVQSLDYLNPPYEGDPNVYIVNGLTPTDTPCLSFSDVYGRWAFSNRPLTYFTGTVSNAVSLAVDIAAPHGVDFETATDYVLQFVSGQLRGYCRQLTNIGADFFAWNTPLLDLPSVGDQFIVTGPQTGSGGPSAPQYLTIKDEDSGYTLTTADRVMTMVRVASPNGIMGYVYLPSNTSAAIPIGAQVILSASDLGPITIRGEDEVVVHTPQSYVIERQYGRVTAIKVDANVWEIDGQLRASVPFSVLPINTTAFFSVIYPAEAVTPVSPETFTYGLYLDSNTLVPAGTTQNSATVIEFQNYSFGGSNIWATALATAQWVRATVTAGGVTLITGPVNFGRIATAEGAWVQFGLGAEQYPSWSTTLPFDDVRSFELTIDVAEIPNGPLLGSFVMTVAAPVIATFRPNFMSGVDMTGVTAFMFNNFGSILDVFYAPIASVVTQVGTTTPLPGGETYLFTVTQISGSPMTYDQGLSGGQGTGTRGTLGVQYTMDAFSTLTWGYNPGETASGTFLITMTSDYTGSVLTVTTGTVILTVTP